MGGAAWDPRQWWWSETLEGPGESQAVQLEGVGLVSAPSLVVPAALLESTPPPSSHSSALSPFLALQAVSALTVLTESSAQTHTFGESKGEVVSWQRGS